MSVDYAAKAETARKMLARFGRTVTRRERTGGTYDPATGTTVPTVQDTDRIGVTLPWGRGQTHLAGSLIAATDVQLLLDAGPIAMTDRFIIDGIEYSVIAIDTLSPAGVPVLHTLQVRKA